MFETIFYVATTVMESVQVKKSHGVVSLLSLSDRQLDFQMGALTPQPIPDGGVRDVKLLPEIHLRVLKKCYKNVCHHC